MKSNTKRRHHNNTGFRRVKRGKTTREVICMAARIFGSKNIDVKGNTIKIKGRVTELVDV